MSSAHDGGDGWDTFDFDTWGTRSDAAGDGEGVPDAAEPNGAASDAAPDEGGRTLAPSSPSGRWVSSGGVLRWEVDEDGETTVPDLGGEQGGNLRVEAASRWAADDLDLPPGVPDAARVRALRAWLARERLAQDEALGVIFLERRKLAEHDPARSAEVAPREDDPLELAVAEYQAAGVEYDQMLDALAEIAAHTGPSLVLVEFYLWLTERLGTAALAPEADERFDAGIPLPGRDPGPARGTPRARAEWAGRADALVRARRRAEFVSAPEEEE